MTNGIQDLCDERRSLEKRRKDDPIARQNYSQVKKEIRRMQQANENWIIDRYNEILKKSILESEQVTLTLNQGGFRHSEVTDAATTDKVKII